MLKTKSIIFALIALIFPIFPVLAQDLEAIPGQTSVDSGDLTGYLENLYNFGISITGILAVFMIAVGAFAYIVTSAGNTSKMMDAKEKITNALIGLVIALTAYLLLYVINPDLVGGTLKTPEAVVSEIADGDEDSNNDNDTYQGAECDYSDSCGSCMNCSDCPGDKYYENASGKYFCGTSPGTEGENEDENEIGCCTFNGSNGCSAGITKSACNAITGSSFVSGENKKCTDMGGDEFLGHIYECQ